MALRLGMLTPSSNTVLEPVTYDLLGDAPGLASAHFARFRVTEIALSEAALGQFDDAPILAAASLLADARCDVIAWNGTSASWLGLERDRSLVRRIEGETGVPATTCVLGLFEALRRLGARTLGLVTPYAGDVQARISERYSEEGVTVTAESHLGITDNFSFGLVEEEAVEDQIRAVEPARPDAIAVVCTNIRSARLAAKLESELSLPILDSVAVTLWAALERIGAPKAALRGAGRVFGI